MFVKIKRRYATRDNADSNLADLQRRLVERLAIMTGAVTGVAAVLLLGALPASLPLLSFALGMIALALVVWFVNERDGARSGALARHLFVWGSAAAAAIALWSFPQTWLPALALPLIFIAAFLVRWADIAVALGFAWYANWLALNAARAYPLDVLALLLVVSVGVARLAMVPLYGALRLAWEAQQDADMLLGQARERQAELGSALKSLELATYQLETANHKLFIARRQTEEAQRTKEQFAANISHELRTPLNVILGFSEMLYVSPEIYGNMAWPTPLRQDVYQIYRSSRHLLALIDDVLELSRFELARFSLNKEPTDASALLLSAIEIVGGLFRNRPIKLETDIEPGVPPIEIDRTRIRQVIINLLTNARNYTKAGVVRLSAKAGEGEVIFSVSDTGPGIPAGKLPYIFDAFYQADTSLRREQGGAGLGLAISKQFVEAHEGRIWAESHEGAGTTVYFSLPLPDGGARTVYPVETRSIEPVRRHERPRLAVIDPDPAVAGLLSRYLEDYDIIAVEDGADLAERLIHQQPRLVIHNVPPRPREESQPGETCWRLPADVATTWIDCSLPSRAWIAADMDISACLTKPVTAEQLYREIDKRGNVREILVIDDDRGFAQLVERILAASGRGLNVRLAFDGREGLEAIRAQRPDLVFLDLAMPVMDGFAVMAQLAQDTELATLPVILLTVTSYAEDALLRHGSQVLVDRPGGLRLAEVLRCLRAIASSIE